MAINVKGILNAGVAAQSAALAANNLKLMKKKNQTPKKFLKHGVTNIVGVNLLRLQAQEIGKL